MPAVGFASTAPEMHLLFFVINFSPCNSSHKQINGDVFTSYHDSGKTTNEFEKADKSQSSG